MNILLDTHILIWSMLDSCSLSAKARNIIVQNRYTLYYSIVSIWEIAIKHKLHPENLLSSGQDVVNLCQEANVRLLPLKTGHIAAFENLSRHGDATSHKDPFDQIIISQAIAENMVFMTHDKTLQYYCDVNILLV